MDYNLPEAKFDFEMLKKIMQSKALLYFITLLLIFKIGVIFISINFPQNIFFADITKNFLQNSVNQTRELAGLKPLVENAKLDQAAQMKAENMVLNNYFAHTSPQGLSPWHWFSQAGYNYKFAGENLAVGFFNSSEVYQAWLNSPEHKANIVNTHYTEVGTAVLAGYGGNNTIVVVQEFASPLPVKQPAVKNSQPVSAAKSHPISQVAIKPATATQASEVPEKVLAGQTELVPVTNAKTNLASKVANYAIYNYDKLLQNVIYGVCLLIIGILMVLLFFSNNITFERKFAFKTILVVVLLGAAALINERSVISLIPHQILI
jgi:hypothetical protein